MDLIKRRYRFPRTGRDIYCQRCLVELLMLGYRMVCTKYSTTMRRIVPPIGVPYTTNHPSPRLDSPFVSVFTRNKLLQSIQSNHPNTTMDSSNSSHSYGTESYSSRSYGTDSYDDDFSYDTECSGELHGLGCDRAVTFFPSVRVNRCLRLSEFTEEEIKASWYNREDFDRIKTEILLTAKLTDVGDLQGDTQEYCRRGTEGKTKEGSSHRSKNKETASVAVFEEQDFQWENGYFDPEILASVYIAATCESQIEAHRKGLQDEIDARDPDSDSFTSSPPTTPLSTPILSSHSRKVVESPVPSTFEISRAERLQQIVITTAAA